MPTQQELRWLLNASQPEKELRTLSQAYKSVAGSGKKAAKMMMEFSSTANGTTATFRSINKEGLKVTSTLEKQGNKWKEVARSTEQATEAVKKYSAAQQRIRTNVRRTLSGQHREGLNAADAGQQMRFLKARNALADYARDKRVSARTVSANLQKLSQPGGLVNLRNMSMAVQQLYVDFAQAAAAVDKMAANTAKATAKTRAAVAAAAKLAAEQAKANSFASKFRETWTTIGRIVTVSLVHRAVFFLTNGLREGVQGAIELQKRIAEIRTISQGQPIIVPGWIEGLRAISDTSGQNITDVTEGAYQALSNQIVQGVDSFGFLQEAATFANTAVTTIDKSVNLLSATLNSFGLTSGSTDKIAAQLFKTIELGRVRADEMSDSLGRVGVLASKLGIQTSELFAAISTLTVKGMKYNEVATQLRGLMVALIKPTRDMPKFLKSMGVATGEAAIAIHGLWGVMAKLEEFTKGSTSELAKLVPRIRGIIAAAGLSGEGLKAFMENWQAIKDAQEDYAKASEIIMNNVGKRLEIGAAQLKNFFRVDIANHFLRTLDRLPGGIEKVVEKLQVLIRVVVRGAIPAALTLVTILGGLKKLLIGGLPIAILAVGIDFLWNTVRAGSKVLEDAATAWRDFYVAATTQTQKHVATILSDLNSMVDARVSTLLAESSERAKILDERVTRSVQAEERITKALKFETAKRNRLLSEMADRQRERIRGLNSVAQSATGASKSARDERIGILVEQQGGGTSFTEKQAGFTRQLAFLQKGLSSMQRGSELYFDTQKRIRKVMQDRVELAQNLASAEKKQSLKSELRELGQRESEIRKRRRAQRSRGGDRLPQSGSTLRNINKRQKEIHRELGEIGKAEKAVGMLMRQRLNVLINIQRANADLAAQKREAAKEEENRLLRFEALREKIKLSGQELRGFDAEKASAAGDLGAIRKQGQAQNAFIALLERIGADTGSEVRRRDNLRELFTSTQERIKETDKQAELNRKSDATKGTAAEIAKNFTEANSAVKGFQTNLTEVIPNLTRIAENLRGDPNLFSPRLEYATRQEIPATLRKLVDNLVPDIESIQKRIHRGEDTEKARTDLLRRVDFLKANIQDFKKAGAFTSGLKETLSQLSLILRDKGAASALKTEPALREAFKTIPIATKNAEQIGHNATISSRILENSKEVSTRFEKLMVGLGFATDAMTATAGTAGGFHQTIIIQGSNDLKPQEIGRAAKNGVRQHQQGTKRQGSKKDR